MTLIYSVTTLGKRHAIIMVVTLIPTVTTERVIGTI